MSALVYAYRGSLVENLHRLSVAVTDPGGKLLAYAGDPDRVAFLRSSAKPFQALALFTSGAAEKFQITQEELALIAASHEGGQRHVAVAQGLLGKIGLGPEYLACGVHPPGSREARRELAASGAEPSVLHNNCSGKHSGMLAVALALGADPKGYELPEHPVQQLNFQAIRDLAGVSAVPYAIDGCSVPTFALPLTKAARMFALLAAPQAAPEKYRPGLERTLQAMRTYPELVAGEGGIDTVLMRKVAGLAAKRGADGYYGMALCESRWGPLGVTLKVEDGSQAAREPAVVRLLELLGALSPDEPLEWRRPAIKNHRGLEAGHLQADIRLTWL